MIRLIATDLDGTLIDQDEGPQDYASLVQAVSRVRQAGGTWCIITGRHVQAMQPVLHEFYHHRLVPDHLVVEDARMYSVRLPLRLWPHWRWNFGIDSRRFLINLKHRGVLRNLLAEIERLVPDGENRSRSGTDIWYHCPDLDQAAAVESHLHERTAAMPDYILLRWATQVCLAPAVGTKEDAIRRLQTKLNLHPSEIFAVGDGANDVPMLRSPLVGWAACVGNASEAVREVIECRGGYRARQTGLRGVLEALEATEPSQQRTSHEQFQSSTVVPVTDRA